MNYNQKQVPEVPYLCGVELPLESIGNNLYVHNNDVSCFNTSYQDLACPEVQAGAGHLTECLPQSALLPTASATMSIDSILPSSSLHLSPHPPDIGTDVYGGGGSPGQYRPTLHVEVCQRPDSTLRCTKLKELVLSMLRQRGTAFGELFLQEFEDPVMKEHVQSVSITDTPHELKVSLGQ